MLEDKIYQDYIAAFKARDKERSQFLSFLRSEMKNAAINLRKDKLSDEEALIEALRAYPTMFSRLRSRIMQTGVQPHGRVWRATGGLFGTTRNR